MPEKPSKLMPALYGGIIIGLLSGIPFISLINCICCAGVIIGGFLAVSWTDTVQASLMIFALILTPIMVIVGNGGFDASMAVIREVDPSRLDWIGKGGAIAIISSMAWGLGYFGQPHILARFMAAASVRSIPAARRIGMTWMAGCLLGSVAVGFFGIAWFGAHVDAAAEVNANSERVFILLAEQLFTPWIAGSLLSAILAAVMSTLSCQLLVCSSVLTEDLYRGFLRKKAGNRELVWVGRSGVLLIALVAIAIAWNPQSRVLGLVSYAWAGFGAAFGPVILLSLYWKRINRNGALAGMLAGAATVILWKQSGSALYEIVPGFIAATIAIPVVSLRTREAPAAVQATHEEVRRELRTTGY